MAELSTIMIYVFAASLVAYIAIFFSRKIGADNEDTKIIQLEKIAQYFSATGSLDKAIRQIIAEQPSSTQDFAKIAQKIDSGIQIENAIQQAAAEAKDEFFSKTSVLMIDSLRKNDANLLYQSVQKIKEVSGLQNMINSKSELAASMLQFVFAVIMPFIYFFLIGTLGFTADRYLTGLLAMTVLASAIFQGIALRQWLSAIVKVPLLFSVFYLIYFVLAPKFLSSLIGAIA